MRIVKAKLSCYSRIGDGYGSWEIDIYLEGQEEERRIVHVSEASLMDASGSTRRGTVKTPQRFLETEAGQQWLWDYLERKNLIPRWQP